MNVSLVKRQLLLTVSVATLVAVLSGIASASRFSIGEPRFRATYTNFRFYNVGTLEIRCPVTLEGSFHSATIRKLQGALVGFITRASVVSASCTGTGGGTSMRWLTTRLPWHIKYETFTGMLPNIATILYRVFEMEFALNYTVMGVPLECLYRTTEPKPLIMTFTYNEVARELRQANPGLEELTNSGGGMACSRIWVTGESASLTRLGFGERLSFRLI